MRTSAIDPDQCEPGSFTQKGMLQSLEISRNGAEISDICLVEGLFGWLVDWSFMACQPMLVV